MARIEALEHALQGGERGHGGRRERHDYFPQKRAVPDIINDQVEKWRDWREDVLDYFDNSVPGMKRVLESVTDKIGDPDENWLSIMTQTFPKVREDSQKIWRALKKLTEGEARKVVVAVESEDGYKAWRRLDEYFEPSLAGKMGKVVAEFSELIKSPARNPEELRKLINELTRPLMM